jgi:hypothetical protein
VILAAALVSDALHQRAVLSEVEHRPWPLPDGPWLMGQTWVDLLFAHRRMPEEALRRVVPPAAAARQLRRRRLARRHPGGQEPFSR